MQIEDFFWSYFKKTGAIDAYLMYKNNFDEEQDPPLAVPKEEV